MSPAGAQHRFSAPYPSPDDTGLEDDHRNAVRVDQGQLQLPKLRRRWTDQLQLPTLRRRWTDQLQLPTLQQRRTGHSRCLHLGSVIHGMLYFWAEY
jgi:hypothetical protein